MVPLQAGDLEPEVQVGKLAGLQAFRMDANMHNSIRFCHPEV
jgi:hypothetical protein